MSKGRDRLILVGLYTVTFLYMGLIFYLSSLTSIDQPGPLGKIPEVDKLEHASEFFVLGALLSLAFQRTPSLPVRMNAWSLALLVAILYAFTDEMHQSFVSGRTTDALDLLADTVGISVASLLGAWLREARASGRTTDRPPVTLTKAMPDSEE